VDDEVDDSLFETGPGDIMLACIGDGELRIARCTGEDILGAVRRRGNVEIRYVDVR